MGKGGAEFSTNRTEFTTDIDEEVDKKSGGCFVSTKKAIIFALFAIISLIAVGATIYFYGQKLDKRQEDANSKDLETLLNDSLNSMNFEDFRLPLNLYPLYYRLRIHPFLLGHDLKTFTFSGEVTILMHCKNTTKKIIFHSDDLKIDEHQISVTTRKELIFETLSELSPDLYPEIINMEQKVNRSETIPANKSSADDLSNNNLQPLKENPIVDIINGTKQIFKYHTPEVIYVNVAKVEEVKKMSRYIIHLGTELQPGTNYTVHLKFSGLISNNLLGLYRTSYLTKEGAKRWIITTHFQPIFARRVFPCFDEPSFKASFEISLARKTNMSSLSNMPHKDSEEMPDHPGWMWDHFEPSPPISPHLVAFTIFDFEFLKPNTSKLNTVLKIWAPKHLLANAKYAVDISPKILTYLQDYYGINFPLSKIDLVAVPALYQNAMENWGLITFRQNALLLDSSADSWSTKNLIFKTIINKFSKQWFGNLVSMDWWSELWLSEGFSTYLEDLVQNAIDPALRDLDTFSLRVIQTSLDSDKLKSVQSLRVDIKEPTQIEQLFDDVAYNKGSCLMRMLNWTLTENDFKKGIRNYLTTWKYKSATIDNFWDSFTYADKNSIPLPNEVSTKDFMDSWITHDGYPVLEVMRDYENGSSVITQKGFGNSHAANDYVWYIPLIYIKQYENASVQTTWMKNQRSITIKNFTAPGSKQWAIFNVEGTGLYRVNYDQTNWDLLTNQLMTDCTKISPTDRGQLLNDAFELASFGLLNYTFAFELTKYMQLNEHNYIPWNSLFNSLKQLKYIIRTTEYNGIFEEYILNLIEPTYKILGNEMKQNESQNDSLLRKFIVSKACEYNYRPCLEWSTIKYQEWMSNENPDISSPIPFDFREIVLCSAIKTGGRKEWYFLWKRTLYPTVSTANLKVFYYSLGCTREPWLINNYLENGVNGSIALQNSKDVWKSLAHPVGINFGFAFLRSNWERIHKNYQHIFINLNSVFEEFLSKLSTKVDLEDLTIFYKNNKNSLSSVSSLMLNIVNKIKWRITWTELKMKRVVQWIIDNSDYFKGKLNI